MDDTTTFARKSLLRLCGREDLAANQTLMYYSLVSITLSMSLSTVRRPVSRDDSSLVKKNATVNTLVGLGGQAPRSRW